MPAKKPADHYRKNSKAILKRRAEHYRKNKKAILKRKAEHYRKNAKAILKVQAERYRKNGSIFMTKAYRKNAKDISNKYHIQKNLKHDAAERMRKQDPRARKTTSLAVIKKQILEKFRFGKNYIKVHNSKGHGIKVRGPSLFRVYIAINNTKRIMQESISPFYGNLQAKKNKNNEHVKIGKDFLNDKFLDVQVKVMELEDSPEVRYAEDIVDQQVKSQGWPSTTVKRGQKRFIMNLALVTPSFLFCLHEVL